MTGSTFIANFKLSTEKNISSLRYSVISSPDCIANKLYIVNSDFESDINSGINELIGLFKSSKEKTAKEQLEKTKKELLNYKVEPDFDENKDLVENLKNLNKQLEKIKIQNVIKDKNKNKIKDKKISNFIIREQVIRDFPPKELRSIIDQGKKDIKKGIIISISTFEDKVGVAVGVTNDLISKYDAVKFVKIASEVLGGKGGGGR